ncbi:MAG TPA: hypothetical protein VMR21_09535 [Vicinamibacteria bacterium]|nr:hypothetical protein [Vicinamibacteria bacterium]
MSNHPFAAGRVLALPVFTVAFAAAGSTPAAAWSPLVHQRVTSEAIDTLPKGLKPFYKSHRLELPSLAVDAPPPGDEGTERRFQIDRLAPFPFKDAPRSEAELKTSATEEAARMGRLPWLIEESYGRLVEAFRSGDKVQILTESDALSGYVADIHNPLALTENSDGQKTEQHGLWVRFSARLPESMDKRLRLKGQAARLVDDPKGYIFSMVRQNYIWLDNLLYREDLARRGQAGYTEFYYEALAEQVGPLLEDRLSAATTDVGSYWYTAWTAAGRPALK